MRAILFLPKENLFQEVEVKGLEDYYKTIKCELVEFVSYSKDIHIIVDEEGLLQTGNYITEVSRNDGEPFMLAGNLLFVGGVDSKGQTRAYKGSIEDLTAICLVRGYLR